VAGHATRRRADGEFQAPRRLADAARAMAGTPAAFQLRLLQTVVDVAAEKNSTLVMPRPVELLRFFDQYTHVAPAADAEPVPVADTGAATTSHPADRINGDLMKASVLAR
jgi:hypothetical protein